MADATSLFVRDLALRIRDLVNDTRLHASLRLEPAKFNKVCAAMDLIEDADVALTEYQTLPPGCSIGYLTLYGVMQALFVQQDGVRYLMNALDLDGWPDLSDEPRLGAPRVARSAATGHPVSFRREGKESSFQVSRGTMRKEGFTLLGSDHSTGDHTLEEIKILDHIAGQEECLAEILCGAIQSLEDREREHRRAFRDEKISAMLPSSYSYLVQKIAEASRSLDVTDITPAVAAVAVFRKAVQEMSDAFQRRGLQDAVLGAIGEISDILDSVDPRLEATSPRSGDAERGIVLRALACRLQTELDRLADVAAEIDLEYESDDIA